MLFSGLDPAELQEMLRIYRRETWPKGARLPARQAVELFTVVISGRLGLTRVNPDSGRQITIFTLGPGDAFDVISLLDRKEHVVDPVAMEDLEIITAPIEGVHAWIETSEAFNRAFLPYLGEKLRALEELTVDLALLETVTRLAKLILAQATPEDTLAGELDRATPLVNTLSDETMARMIGSVRVVVNRHIQEFTKMGLISTSRGRLVLDLVKLHEYCEKLLSR